MQVILLGGLGIFLMVVIPPLLVTGVLTGRYGLMRYEKRNRYIVKWKTTGYAMVYDTKKNRKRSAVFPYMGDGFWEYGKWTTWKQPPTSQWDKDYQAALEDLG